MAATHIVAIPSWYSSGRGSGGGYFRDQALALQSAGHRVALLAPDIFTARDLRAGQASAEDSGRVAITHDGVELWRLARRVRMPRLPYRNPIAWSLCGLDLFAAYVAQNGLPDLVHAQCCLNAGVLAALVRRRYGVPFALTEHSTSFAQGRLRWWERDLVRRVTRRAAALLAVSPDLVRLLERDYPRTRWSYVPNILGDAFLAPAPVRPARPTGAGRPFVFLCAARMWPEKNHALLIDGFADAFAGNRETRLLLAGSGPLRPTLEQQCRDRGIAAQAGFLGDLPATRLRGVMDEADAFVLASDVETFGVVVIEAQSAGLPVVCTASGGPEHLIDAATGLVVPTGDRAALCHALIEMRETAARYHRAQISADAIGRFGPDAFVRRFAEAIA